ncbi:NADH-quinone oxidoreductase subunit J [Pradoshia sp. D12]|uniref:NADH-quinone oxidoreductase subunit J n=1 Tax=Bacillaceae TaxID=186817 RepID=UPI00111E0385|nr:MULTISPECIES: NADH-quinone oxidoreductase subunit J [Bacillaceae]QFK72978.1 NADH-quinone oxidoreductase subunit J [Pradoshia sp. D12]TPF71970.1 NADH-quinone oxidoreductase subunit J [Bacillus sp. D12]
MSGEMTAFIVLGLIAICGAVLMIHLTKVMHMMVSLVFTFISIAGIYVLLSAEFVAVVQIMIYSGAITIIMLFGIMLTNHRDPSVTKAGMWRKAFVLIGVLGFAGAVYAGIYNLNFAETVNTAGGETDLVSQSSTLHLNNTEKIGIAIYTKFVIPFELVSVLLLVALVGAVVLAKKDDQKEGEEK